LSPGDVVLAKILNRRGDKKWQLALEQIPEVEGGLLSIAPHTGHIKAMVGGYDFSRSQFNRALQAVRQPGSAFKPIVYAAAVNEGFTPASIIIDSPVIFKENEAMDKWKPANFEEKFHGPTSLRTALTHSRNVVTIKLLQEIGVQKAIQFARDLGIVSPLEENLSIALGSSGVTLFELTSAYSTFANLGKKVEPVAIRHIKNRDGKIIHAAQPRSAQVMSSGTAYIVTSMMESVVQDGTARKVKALRRPVAGKTGTTNSFVDAWFMGFTPELVTGVWVGKDKDEPLGANETGSRAAIPIWLQYMEAALADKPVKNFPVPDDVIYVKINPETGKRVAFNDPQGEFEVFRTDYPPEHGMESASPVAEANF
jgi:penicillin-binding protein 1A